MPGEGRASTSSCESGKTWMAGTSPAMTALRQTLRHHDLAVFRRHRAVVVEPAEAERAARGRAHVELDVRVGRDRGLEVDAEQRRAVEGAGELVDDLARDELAGLVLAKARLYDVGDEGADLDHLALLGALRQLDANVLGHCAALSPRTRRRSPSRSCSP